MRRLLLFAIFAAVAACAHGSYDLEEKLLCPVLPSIRRIAVAPFDIPAGGPNGLVREGKVAEGAVEKLAAFAGERLGKFGCFDVVTAEEVIGRFQRNGGLVLADGRKDVKSYVMEVGRLLNADSVLTGYVLTYSDRVGEKYGVTRPASVGFALFLHSAKDGSLIWSGKYRETQTSLSENLFNLRLFWRRGLKWLTADELARWGVDETMRQFPGVTK